MGFWSDTFGGGNSFSESVANVTTPRDDYEYRGGTLYGKDNKAVDYNPDTGKYGGAGAPSNLGAMDSKSTNAYDYNLSQGNAGATPLGPNADSSRGGLSNGLGAMMRSPVAMGGLGLMSGGIGAGLMTGAIAAGRGRKYDQKNPAYVNKGKGDPNFQKKAAAQEFSRNFGRLGKEGRSFTKDQLTQIREDPKARIEGAFFKDGDTSKQFKMNMFGNSYEINPETGNSKLIEDQAAAAGGEGGIPTVRPVATQATAPTSIMPAISTESEFAKQQMVSPPAEWLIKNGYADTNPSYDALVKYNTDLRAGVLTMSEGGRLGQMQMRQIGPNAGGGIGRQMEMGGLQQYGAYLDNRYGDPEFDQKRMQFLRDVNQQEQQTFGSGGGGSFPSSGLGGKGGAGDYEFMRKEQALPDQLTDSQQPPTNSLYKGLSPVFGGAMGGARAALGMAEGGDVEFALGGNEKDLINAAERAVRNGLQAQGMARGGDMDISNEDKIAIAQYVEQYGKPALMQLVDSVRTGEADETRKRFASGENGEVRGNGDGSGTDDKITAQLKDGDATQDVLLADGEFVLRKDAYEALKGAGVNVDKVNDAGSNAAKELNKMMTA